MSKCVIAERGEPDEIILVGKGDVWQRGRAAASNSQSSPEAAMTAGKGGNGVQKHVKGSVMCGREEI